MARRLNTTVMVGDVVYDAGTLESDIDGKVDAKGVWDGEPDEGAAGSAYDGLDVDGLKAEIDKRNEGRDDESKLSKRGGQDTLVGVLVADDAAQED